MKTLNRPKLNYKMHNIFNYPISFLSAPSGFGKTTSLHLYLDNQDVNTVWFSMYKQEDEQWAWAKIISSLSTQFSDIDFFRSIPNTRNSINKFIDCLEPQLDGPLFIILDDVEILDIPNIMELLSIYSHTSISFLHFIVITKNVNETLSPYQFNNNIFILSTIDFAFSKEEVLHLCRLQDIVFSDEQIDHLYDFTNGWIIALTLLIESYKRNHNFYYQGDLNNLISSVIYDSLPPETKEGFMKLSLLKSFTLSIAHDICKNQDVIQKLVKLEKENHFIQTINHQTYQFIPIFKEYLEKQLLISTIDSNKLMNELANCYLMHDEPIEALDLYLKHKNYCAIMDVINQYQDISFADIAPNLMINIFNTMPDTYINQYPYIYLKWITDCITNFPQLNGPILLDDFKNRIDDGVFNEDKQQLYGEYYLIHAFVYFNDVKMMINDFKTSSQYFNGNHSKFAYSSMITSFGSCHMLFLYYNKLGSLKETVEFIHDEIGCFIQISNGLHSGSSNLVKAEYLFETGDYDQVYLYATLAYKEAMDKNQMSSAICCLFVLARLYLIQHKNVEYDRTILLLSDFYKKTNIPIIHNEIDCALSYLYILNNQFDKVKPWLKNGFFDDEYLLPESNIIAYIIHGMCLIRSHESKKLMQICSFIKEKNKTMPFVLSDIYVSIFEVTYNYVIGQTQLALIQLDQTIGLCKHDGIISPIVELAFAFPQLIQMYTSRHDFGDKVIKTTLEHLKRFQYEDVTPKTLTIKEFEILELFAKGEKTKDIAANKHISINTVQTHLKSIYKKLSINSKSEATKYYFNNFE